MRGSDEESAKKADVIAIKIDPAVHATVAVIDGVTNVRPVRNAIRLDPDSGRGRTAGIRPGSVRTLGPPGRVPSSGLPICAEDTIVGDGLTSAVEPDLAESPGHQQLVSQYNELAELAGSLAHEIKNPLSVIRMNMDLLAEGLNEAETPRERRFAPRSTWCRTSARG